MMWNNSFFFDPVYLSKTPDEPPDISRVIFEFFVTKTFKGKSCSKIDVCQNNWVLIGPFRRLDVGCNTWIGPCLQLHWLQKAIDKEDCHEEDGQERSNVCLYFFLASNIEAGQRHAKHVQVLDLESTLCHLCSSKSKLLTIYYNN